MPAATVHQVLAEELGPQLAAAVPRRSTTSRPPPRRSARCTARSGRTAATSRSRSSTRAPATALLADLNQLGPARPAVRPAGSPGLDVKPLLAELQGRVAEELDYALEAEAQRGVRRGVRRRPGHRRARGRRRAPSRSSSPSGSTGTPLSRIIADGTAERARPRRPRCYLRVPALRARAGRAAARRPAPGQLPAARRTAGSASSTSARSPGCPTGCRAPIGRLLALALAGDAEARARRAARRGLRQASIDVDAEALLDYLRADPGAGWRRAFQFTRAWLRGRRSGSSTTRAARSGRLGLQAQPAAVVPADPPGRRSAPSACSASSRPRCRSGRAWSAGCPASTCPPALTAPDAHRSAAPRVTR